MAYASHTISLSPSAGFCVKSTAQNSVACPPSTSSDPSQSLPIPAGLKIFVNIAWDANIPPPPEGTPAAIEQALSANVDISPHEASQWIIPLIVSDPRADKDKGTRRLASPPTDPI